METAYFSFIEIVQDSPEYLQYLNLRHKIFCHELRRVVGSDNHKGMSIETDQYDACSRHLLAIHLQTGEPAACARLILPGPHGLNLETRYKIEEFPYTEANASNTGEISRMAISPSFRRRKEDKSNQICGNPIEELPNHRQENNRHRQHQPELVLGMYREIYLLAKELGIQYCYAAMDGVFSRLLSYIGFPFKVVGPYNRSVHPHRRPFIISQQAMEMHLEKNDASLMRFLEGEEYMMPKQMAAKWRISD